MYHKDYYLKQYNEFNFMQDDDINADAARKIANQQYTGVINNLKTVIRQQAEKGGTKIEFDIPRESIDFVKNWLTKRKFTFQVKPFNENEVTINISW